MAKKSSSRKKQYSEAELDAFVREFNPTGFGTGKILRVFSSELKKQPQSVQDAIQPLYNEYAQTSIDIMGKFSVAKVVHEDTAEMQRLRDEMYLNDVRLMNGILLNGGMPILLAVEKAGAIVHWSNIRHDYIFYPNDVEVLHQKGYNFNEPQNIDGQQMDFTAYNLNHIQYCSEQLGESVQGLLQGLNKTNQLIARHQELEEQREAEKNAARKRQIKAEMDRINNEYKATMNALYETQDMANQSVLEFSAARQRLMKTLELNCLSPENIQKIQDANVGSLLEGVQQNYEVLQRINAYMETTVADNGVRSVPHIATASAYTTTPASTLAGAANNMEMFNQIGNIPTAPKLGSSVNMTEDIDQAPTKVQGGHSA